MVLKQSSWQVVDVHSCNIQYHYRLGPQMSFYSPSRIRVSEFEQFNDSLFSERGGGSEIGLSTRVESILNENTCLAT